MVITLIDIFEILLGSLSRNTGDIFQLFFLLTVAYICFWQPQIIIAIFFTVVNEIQWDYLSLVKNLKFSH